MRKRDDVPWMVGLGLLLLLAGAPVRAAGQETTDMQAYLNQTRERVREGRYQEALERMLWFHHNALTYMPSMAGVRLSFALADWKRLADEYKPALDSMIATRSESERQFFRNPGDRRHFLDVRAFNRVLGEEHRTLEIFDRLATEHPEAAKVQWLSLIHI